MSQPQLARTLTPVMIWGLGVGYVISGMYFGWNLGLAEGGTLGMALATALVVVLYACFTPTYAELACAMPKAGGILVYAGAAFGPRMGFLAGLAQVIEFVLAPPAIAAAIGAYFHLFLPQVPVMALAIAAYVLFTVLNVVGVKAAAIFELVITILAVGELLLFAGITVPHVRWDNLVMDAWPNGWSGTWAAVPFAIWFFLGLEGVANIAEEAQQPQRSILRGFGSALATLVVLCVLTFVCSVGVGGWSAVVYPAAGSTPSDSPLPLALARVTDGNGAMYHLLVSIGLLGLVASFHGIMLASGRAVFEMGRAGQFPRLLGRVHPRFQTPHMALLVNMVLGILALLTGRTGDIIILACFGAITLFILAAASHLRLRKTQPALHRPFLVPGYPWLPLTALFTAAIAAVAMVMHHLQIFLVYAAWMVAGLLYFTWYSKQKT